MRGNNDKTVNWISMIVKNLADTDSIAPWSDVSLCMLTDSQPPVTQRDIMSMTASNNSLTKLRSYIAKEFPETMAELQPDLEPY